MNFKLALKQLEKMMVEFAKFHNTTNVIEPLTPKAGDYCSSQFIADKQWFTLLIRYRARVLKVTAINSYKVLYIDYGNSEIVPGSRLRPLPPQFSPTKLASQAHEAKLAYIGLANEETGFAQEAFTEMCSLFKTNQLSSVCVAKSAGIESVILKNRSNTSKSSSLNTQLVRLGLAVVDQVHMKKYMQEQRAKLKDGSALIQSLGRSQGAPKKSELESLIEAQEEAKKARLNVWQYGDFTQDDDL